jgi:hypothetical protein
MQKNRLIHATNVIRIAKNVQNQVKNVQNVNLQPIYGKMNAY